ncbi:amidohydrolase [Actinomadura madurae]|uniref:amidohydrolase n=1 Tax=Actinomadura madurae TaxID=1993 RepID=UPI0020261D29|nr:amidohydrolase [Actinomadura madurae]MCP9972170.1 amidohydrolase [Actinomadura madurae]MCP9984674.1 amidohydrolase [Actinomadura madurae]MCQ0003774.1 amidohydrolase [Actinomadura madurae]MCQ0020867.1 amidohydrolase [Actinomadura madurae]URN00887.1 amidohydrolase [Actinomadura madurae]
MLPAGAAHASPSRGPADLIIHNGRVLLLDKHFRKAQAVAIRGGRILAVGSEREIDRFKGRRTELLDAGGGTVLPGINDSHNHVASLGLSVPPYNLGVDTDTIEELVAVIRKAAEEAPSSDSWIRGRGWQELRLPRAPVAADIDPVSGDHPVVLNDFSGHAVSVNSVVMRLAGITRDTVPPTGGVIDKDANGEPTGVFRETAQGLVTRVVPGFSQEERSQAIDAAVSLLHTMGVTSATEPGTAPLDLYAEKERADALRMRITVLLRGGNSPQSIREAIESYEPLEGVDPRMLNVVGLKVFADGIPRFRTAWMNEPYLDGSRGSMTIVGASPDEQVANLHEMIKLAADAGLQVGTHSCGDATTDATVAGYVKAAGRDWRRKDLRNYVIHCNFPSARTLRTMARNGIGANMNAEILYLQGRVLEPIIGAELTEYQWPYRSALGAGVQVTTGSDAPVVAFHWLQGVMSAQLREGADGRVAGTAERISAPQALATYTRTGAWQDHAEKWKGTLERGMAADVCVVDGDVLTRDPHELIDMKVAATVVDGKVVYERGDGAKAKAAAAAFARAGLGKPGHTCTDPGRCCCQVADEISRD